MILPPMMSVFEDGTTLGLYRDRERSCAEIAKFSKRDAETYRWLAGNASRFGFFNPSRIEQRVGLLKCFLCGSRVLGTCYTGKYYHSGQSKQCNQQKT